MPSKEDYAKDPEKYRRQAREWYQNNLERARKRNAEYAKKNADRVRASQSKWCKANRHKRSEYAVATRRKSNGFTREVFAQRLAEQNGSCGICGVPLESGLGAYAACADHCHATNAARGILCKRCNLMLGLARDGEEILRSAIAYLRRFREQECA